MLLGGDNRAILGSGAVNKGSRNEVIFAHAKAERTKNRWSACEGRAVARQKQLVCVLLTQLRHCARRSIPPGVRKAAHVREPLGVQQNLIHERL